MNVLQTILEALESLTSNKMRSGLTVLGIVIGVAAVIAMMAIGAGVQDSITGQIQGIGTNLIFISSGNQQADVRNPKPLTLADAEALADPLAAPSIAAVAPTLGGSMEVTVGGEASRISITGVTPAYASVANETVTEGEFITEEYVLARSAVAVIGPDTAEKLLGRTEGVTGETVRIAGTPYRIIGVLKSKGGSGFGSQDDRILVPLTTAQSRLFQRTVRDSVDSIQAQAVDAESVSAATEEIAQILRTRHRTEVGLDDFTFFTQDAILSTAQSITGVLTLFLGGIAGISLLVGGIGIMNIMLVSVTERTREIGLRKAIGARKRDILVQFLTESILLSLLGGLIGILLAWGMATLVGAIAAASGTPINPQITLDAVLLATLFSMAVGLLFGIYPANRAAGLQPVEALRYE
ncbi:MAG TPA: ABC transporter permease [Anaerolineaceae bacterium]|nr:ABC transporter permease [Anaerolineaceae bacterium]